MKMGWTGLESAGKSQLMAVHSTMVYARNVRWLKKRARLGLESVPRTMAFDTPMSSTFIEKIKSRGLKYVHFRNLTENEHLGDIDIFINEINKYFPSRGSDPLTPQQEEYLTQGAKRGIDIYFCSQDFSQAHKRFRQLTNRMYYVVKMFGSIRPVPSAPPVNHIWGLALAWRLNPQSFNGDDASMRASGISRLLPSPYWFNRTDCNLYDTSFIVPSTDLPPVYFAPRVSYYLDSNGQVVDTKTRYARK